MAAAAAASAQSSKHDPAKGQWDFAQRAQRAAQAEEQAAAVSSNVLRSGKKGHHQRHGSASDKEVSPLVAALLDTIAFLKSMLPQGQKFHVVLFFLFYYAAVCLSQ